MFIFDLKFRLAEVNHLVNNLRHLLVEDVHKILVEELRRKARLLVRHAAHIVVVYNKDRSELCVHILLCCL